MLISSQSHRPATSTVDCCEYCEAAGTFRAAAVLEKLLQTMVQGDAPHGALYAPLQSGTRCVSHRARRLPDGQPEPRCRQAVQRYPVHTVKDVLDSPAWPCGRLRIAITRWSFIEVLIEPV